MAKKRFGIDNTTNQALSQTMQMAKDHDSNFINTEIFISKIEIDPDNPRKHKITIEDLPNGPSNSDKDYEAKNKEYEGLCELSASIKKDGLLHPIVVYKKGDNYKLVAGERRFFATILAKKNQIEARVYKNKPKPFDLKVVQWMENESRKDLSLYNKLMNIDAIVGAFNGENTKPISAIKLSEILSMSRQAAQFYMGILRNKVLMKVIKEGRVSRFRDARELINLTSESDINNAIDQSKANSQTENSSASPRKAPTAKTTKAFSLGNTQNPHVVKTIVKSVTAMKQFKKHADEFSLVNWDSVTESKRALKKLIKLIENEV